jgi:glycosyltransferase involved in cell wall biosynthesis
VPERILELEGRSSANPDVVIQNVLPHMMDYNGKIAKNIGLYYTETTKFSTSGWPERINTMDEAWVVNHQAKLASEDSGVRKPIHVVAQPCDISKFRRSYNELPFKQVVRDKFIFYTIGETNRRKHLDALIKAFHIEFSPEEPVELLIKTTPVGVRGAQEIAHQCNEIKQYLKLYPSIEHYKQEIIIVDHWSDEKVAQLHNMCDCFVSASYGEAWCIPAFEALGTRTRRGCSKLGRISGIQNYSPPPPPLPINTITPLSQHKKKI